MRGVDFVYFAAGLAFFYNLALFGGFSCPDKLPPASEVVFRVGAVGGEGVVFLVRGEVLADAHAR